MPIIRDLIFSIDRETHLADSFCSITYAYLFICVHEETEKKLQYSVTVEIWGQDFFLDDHLGEKIYDPHVVLAAPAQKIERNFFVPCIVLNEDFGKDEIYIKVTATGPDGRITVAQSDIVQDSF